MREICFALDKVEEQFQSLEVKPGVKAHPQLLKLFVIAKRLGVANDVLIAIIVKHFKTSDRFYIDRLLPLVVRNPKTGVCGQVFVGNKQYGDCFMNVDKINDDGLCTPIMYVSMGEPDGDRDLKQKITNVLSLLGY